MSKYKFIIEGKGKYLELCSIDKEYKFFYTLETKDISSDTAEKLLEEMYLLVFEIRFGINISRSTGNKKRNADEICRYISERESVMASDGFGEKYNDVPAYKNIAFPHWYTSVKFVSDDIVDTIKTADKILGKYNPDSDTKLINFDINYLEVPKAIKKDGYADMKRSPKFISWFDTDPRTLLANYMLCKDISKYIESIQYGKYIAKDGHVSYQIYTAYKNIKVIQPEKDNWFYFKIKADSFSHLTAERHKNAEFIYPHKICNKHSQMIERGIAHIIDYDVVGFDLVPVYYPDMTGNILCYHAKNKVFVITKERGKEERFFEYVQDMSYDGFKLKKAEKHIYFYKELIVRSNSVFDNWNKKYREFKSKIEIGRDLGHFVKPTENDANDTLFDYLDKFDKIAFDNINDFQAFKGLSLSDELKQILSMTAKEYMTEKPQQWPNFAILGAPGVGKTTLANALKKYFNSLSDIGSKKSSKDIEALSASSLKGKFVGHTKNTVGSLVLDCSNRKDVFFIDEAYEIFDDSFGREAVNILLPLLSGDTAKIDVDISYDKDKSYHIDLNKPFQEGEVRCGGYGVPPIWLAGYSSKMRKMLSANPGLYRRMVILELPTPTAKELFESLINNKSDEFKSFYKEHEKTIKNYFNWGTRPEYVEYFANYAGVEKLHKRVAAADFINNSGHSFSVGCDFSDSEYNNENNDKEKLEAVDIEDIIDDLKAEIRKQYRAVISASSANFLEVSTDIDINLGDVKGCGGAKKYLEIVADMLVNTKKYSDKGITLPKGLLMKGFPGTGKTYIAKATAGEVQKRLEEKNSDQKIGFISVPASLLMTQAQVNERQDNKNSSSRSVSNIEILFGMAEDYDKCIIFIDEIDA
ncbi:MAG: AAA family ATPase, partial [Firmicutes bacterium]|nr:AAA family ATPase [Bacillota bacterium]